MPHPPPAPWRVVLFTDAPYIVPAWSQLLVATGQRLVGVVTSARRNADYLEVVAAAGPGVEVLVSDRPRLWVEMLRPLRPDLLIATSFPHRLPADLLALPTLGAINLHPAPLPRYRGTDTLQWQLRHGEPQGGVTLHRMGPDYDTGPILGQAAVPIYDDDDEASLLGKIAAATPAMVVGTLPRLAAGDAGEPQDEAQASYYGRIADEAAWKTIDWTQPARTVHNVVRSSGFARELPPGAVGTIDGVPHRITKTRLGGDMAGGGQPGTLIGREESTLFVQCGDAPIAVVAHAPV